MKDPLQSLAKQQKHMGKAPLLSTVELSLKTAISAITICERFRPGLSQLDCWRNRQGTPLQDRDHSGNDPRLVPGFLRRRSGMFPERFRSASVSVGSREIHLM